MGDHHLKEMPNCYAEIPGRYGHVGSHNGLQEDPPTFVAFVVAYLGFWIHGKRTQC